MSSETSHLESVGFKHLGNIIIIEFKYNKPFYTLVGARGLVLIRDKIRTKVNFAY